MKTYYEVLEIEKDADERQIKSAYFKLVRKYPPEKFPEEFKLLREAYETLSDKNKRAGYDSTRDLPEEAAYLYGQAQKARRESRISDATEILKMITKRYPALLSMKVELARSYEDEDKTGNAIKVWEDLCKRDPANSMYSFELALSYSYRGWRVKALEQYERTLAIDPGNAEVWVELIECYVEVKDGEKIKQLVFEALESIVNKTRTGCVQLYTYAFFEHINDGDKPAAESCLQEIVEILRIAEQYPTSESETAVFAILAVVSEPGNSDMMRYIDQMVDLIPGIDDEIRKTVGTAKTALTIEALVDEGYSVLFHDLFGSLLEELEGDGDGDDEDIINDIMAMEANILMDLPGYRTQILRLKKEHPELYSMHSAFFNEALLARDPDKLLYQRLKKLAKQGFSPNIISPDGTYIVDGDAGFEDDFTEQVTTYRRDGPKTGRNDPCPCGSGKKYKKCCGA